MYHKETINAFSINNYCSKKNYQSNIDFESLNHRLLTILFDFSKANNNEMKINKKICNYIQERIYAENFGFPIKKGRKEKLLESIFNDKRIIKQCRKNIKNTSKSEFKEILGKKASHEDFSKAFHEIQQILTPRQTVEDFRKFNLWLKYNPNILIVASGIYEEGFGFLPIIRQFVLFEVDYFSGILKDIKTSMYGITMSLPCKPDFFYKI